MEYETILLDITDGLGVVTLQPSRQDERDDRADAGGNHACDETRSRHARCVVLTGAGGAFCSGQDLGDASSTGKIDLERSLRDEYRADA